MGDGITERFAALETEIEEAFSFLAEAYPRLLQEVNAGRSYADELIAAFSGSEEHGSGRGASLKAALEDAESVLENDFRKLDQLESDERKTRENLQAAIKDVSALEEVISDIIDSSGGLEIIALNSMVQALKVGSDGGGFSYIAREMSLRTDRAIGLAGAMADEESSLLDESRKFAMDAEGLGDAGRRLSRDLAPAFRAELIGVRSMVREAVDVVSGMAGDAESLRTPLFSLMESIQQQDIIKQSLEQVVDIIQSLPEEIDEDEDEALNQLHYSEQVSLIGSGIIREIAALIRRTGSFIDTQVKSIESEVEEMRTRHRSLSAEYASADPDNPGKASRMMKEIDESRDELAAVVTQMGGNADLLGGLSRKVIAMSDAVHRTAEDMVHTIDGFWNIIIAARMEAVKQKALTGLEQTVDEMDELVDTLSRTAGEASDRALSVKVVMQPSLEAHEQKISVVSRTISEIDANLEDILGRLGESLKGLASDLRDFSVFSEGFFSVFHDSRACLDKLTLYARRLDEAGDELESQRESALAEKNRRLEARGLDVWTLKDNRLQDLVDGFTIFANKRLAHAVAGSNIEEERSEEGEVTLF